MWCEAELLAGPEGALPLSGSGHRTWMFVSRRMAESGSVLLPGPMRKGALLGITMPTCCAREEPASSALFTDPGHCPNDVPVSVLSPAGATLCGPAQSQNPLRMTAAPTPATLTQHSLNSGTLCMGTPSPQQVQLAVKSNHVELYMGRLLTRRLGPQSGLQSLLRLLRQSPVQPFLLYQAGDVAPMRLQG
jgi:hypothetical protein